MHWKANSLLQFGPLIVGFLPDATGRRWLFWIQLIFASVDWILITFTEPETYTPTILARRAEKPRSRLASPTTSPRRILTCVLSASDLACSRSDPSSRFSVSLLSRPSACACRCFYGLLCIFFITYPVIYQKRKGYSARTAGLMFIPLPLV